MGDWISGMISGMVAQERAIAEAKRLERELGTARFKGEKHCLRCSWCCRIRPGVPAPEELEAIAAHLGLTTEDCIDQFFTIDRRGDIYYLKVVGTRSKIHAGAFLPSEDTFDEGPCVFLDGKNCKIYEVRPKECREMQCWNEDGKSSKAARDTWRPDKLKTVFGINGEELEGASW